MIKKYLNLIIGSSLILLFVIWTILVKTIDVRPIGPLGSEVGLASFNQYFFNLIGYNNTLYKITDVLTYIFIVIALIFVVLAIYSIIEKRSIKKLNYRYYILFSGYGIIVITYILFELLKLNYRPVLIDNQLEASYPSSHMLLSIFILLSAINMTNYLLKDKKIIRNIINISLILLLVFNIVGRIISGVHWMSDIIGGAFVSLGVYFIYIYFNKYFNEKLEKENVL